MNILDLISDNQVLEKYSKNPKQLVVAEGITEAMAIAYQFLSSNQSILVIKNSLFNAQKLYNELLNLVSSEQLLFFPIDESLRINAIAASNELLVERLFTLSNINNGKYITITHIVATIHYLPPSKLFKDNIITLKKGDTFKREELIKKLIAIGYHTLNKIEHPLQIAHRGDIVDIFSANYQNPIRIEFFDNEIDSIRFFDISSQLTIEKIDEVTVLPATDILLSTEDLETCKEKILNEFNKMNLNQEKKELLNDKIHLDIEMLTTYNIRNELYQYYHLISDTNNLLDYFNGAVILSNYSSIQNNYELFEKESFEFQQELFLQGKALNTLSLHDNLSIFSNIHTISFEENSLTGKELNFRSREIIHSNGLNELTATIINNYLESNTVIFAVHNKIQKDSIISYLELNRFKYNFTLPLINNGINILEFPLNNGIELLDEKLAIFSPRELFNLKSGSKKYFSRYNDAVTISNVDELLINDYVVHDEHGIGQFQGIETKEISGIIKDYLKINYKNDEVLYVPLEKFQLVKKFLSSEGAKPKLNKLSGDEWKKTKAKIKARVNLLADELVKLYSLRSEKIGFAFPEDNELQVAFENDFPYQLTADQERSVLEIKKDMEDILPMERLLCGDVGFGKTEVAFRAVFKALSSGKQVIILAPTTILARQHYERALDRFKNFNFKIALLSRLISEAKIKETIQEINESRIDLIVGTHKALNDKIKYQNLGLIIVDEEQRFGVSHKEKIKLLKSSVDVLSLSATPIPRTLQLSLIGVRGLSQIDTPPSNRMPVQTYVLEKNEKIIKEVIEREMARGGQVFYLYNNTEKLYAISLKLKEVLKSARIEYVHGQMDKNLMEDIMNRFYNGEIDVLVCTTIIESGLDIPNANTIIIENAENLGLSQLYQIKGRVGRSDRLGYAYLFYNKSKVITEIAQKRLKSIKDFTELGSGYKIAMRDLSIRGAGDLLGVEQSGFIDTVGMDLYVRLLRESIAEKRNQEVIIIKENNLNLPLSAYVPDEYAGSSANKFEIYKMIIATKTLSELENVEQSIKDLYGKIQGMPIKQLLEKRKLDILSRNIHVDEIINNPNFLEVVLTKEFSNINSIGEVIFKETTSVSELIELVYIRKQIRARITKSTVNWLTITSNFLELINKLNIN